ncbi:MAG: cob(I)yrinic acid a,c-diamide adenosyltransferase [Bryobacteraceae bacterium]
MSKEQFDPPHLTISRVYTRGGDEGETALAGGQRVAKDGPRIEAYGTVDELNAFVGAARATAEALVDRDGRAWTLVPVLLRIQHELFNLGSILATLPEDVHPRQPRVTGEEVTRLETEMDRINHDMAPLRSFVLPGSGRLNSDLHLCRVVCRRAERAVVALARIESVPPEAIRYLNRLSDVFFVWSRWATHITGDPETLWDPNHASSAHPGG